MMETYDSEMNILTNSKNHDIVDDVGVPMKTLLEEDRFDDPDGGLENEEFLPNADGKKAIRFTDFEGKTSFGMSVFNLGNAIMGSGILGLAYAMANTGILLFLFLLTAVAALSSYSIHLLLKAAGIVGIRAYEQLGYRAFGIPGKMAAGIAITLQNIGAMSSYLYIVKSELPLVIQAFLKADPNSDLWYLNGNYLVIIVSASVILPLALMKQLGYLGYTSGFSLSCMVFFLTAVTYKKFQIPCPFEEFYNGTAEHHSLNVSSYSHEHVINDLVHEDDGSHCAPRMITLNSQTAYTIPILAFAFVCHPEVLPIYTELSNPTRKRMQNVSNISIFVMYTMYFLAALFGYLTFYDKVEPELLHTYARIDPYDTLILCVRVAVLTAVTLTVPIVLFPVGDTFFPLFILIVRQSDLVVNSELNLMIYCWQVRRAILQMLFPTKAFSWIRHVAIAVVLLILINLLVIFAPNILGIFGFIGATSAPCLIFIFPAIFYIRIVPNEREPMTSRQKILAACFAALGVSFMVMSLSFIIMDWATGSSRAAGGH
uniref:Sodium-coupled neutral amino acid transporter 3-like n=1 Tax=Gouania willdenowi TaxID=441366 RepID=A0A8C5ESN8_GOUWI